MKMCTPFLFQAQGEGVVRGGVEGKGDGSFCARISGLVSTPVFNNGGRRTAVSPSIVRRGLEEGPRPFPPRDERLASEKDQNTRSSFWITFTVVVVTRLYTGKENWVVRCALREARTRCRMNRRGGWREGSCNCGSPRSVVHLGESVKYFDTRERKKEKRRNNVQTGRGTFSMSFLSPIVFAFSS